MRKLFLLLIVLVFTVFPLLADNDPFILFANYNTPYNNQVMDPHIGVGGSFQFWGVFSGTATIFTEVVTGGDNIFNIERFDPLGLFSMGFGMRIPVGGNIRALLDWQKYYRGLGSDQGVYSFSDSWKIGLSINLSDSFGLEFYKRTLYNFTEDALNDPDTIFNDTPSDDGIEIVGIAFNFYL